MAAVNKKPSSESAKKFDIYRIDYDWIQKNTNKVELR